LYDFVSRTCFPHMAHTPAFIQFRHVKKFLRHQILSSRGSIQIELARKLGHSYEVVTFLVGTRLAVLRFLVKLLLADYAF
jgi:hypothetical protein